MFTGLITRELLADSVIAVPPLARDENLAADPDENTKIIRHIESGGVSTLLYGGNANFYHLRLSEYADVLEVLALAAGENTCVVPSVGPAFGTMTDQAKILREFDFPTAMVLPHQGITTTEGVAAGFRSFVKAYGKPAVLYIKHEGFTTPESVGQLVDEGLVSWIKYAIVRDDPTDDPFLRELVDRVDPDLIISGIGEQPAIVHLRAFGLNGFTSGCVCVNPALSQSMLKAISDRDLIRADEIRQIFKPLEDLRNAINPIRVLHEAVTEAGIADTGLHLPLLSPVTEHERNHIRAASQKLLDQ